MNDAVETVRARALAPSVAPKSPAWYLAIGLHVGFGLVCVSAAITAQTPEFPKRAWGAPILVGLALVISFVATRGRFSLTNWGRLLLALGLGLALGLAYDPQLADLPGLSGLADSSVAEYSPSLATLGSLVVLLFWLLLAATGAERMLRPVPLRRSVLFGFLLVSITAIVMYLYLGTYYNLEGPVQTIDLLQKAVQYVVLVGAALGLSGAIGVRGWPQLYVGLALLGAFARNLLVH